MIYFYIYHIFFMEINMKNRIVNFINILRESNIRISVSESIESCNALQLCDITNKEHFKIALQSTLIKQDSDLSTFNRIFELYFAEPFEKNDTKIDEDDFNTLLQQLQEDMQNNEFNELESQIDNSQQNNQFKNEPTSLNNEFKQYDKNKINKDILTNGTESAINDIAKQIANSRNFEDWESNDLNELVDRMLIQNGLEYCKACAKQENRKSKHEEIDERYDKLRKLLKEEIEKSMVKQFGEEIINDLVENNNILDMDLGRLNADELEQIQNIIKKIVKKISTHVSRKDKNSKKGNINIRKTIKKSVSNGTTSSNLQFKNKKKTKSELVVLCDISGSVWEYVLFMLQLAIGIQNVFDRVETYIFVDHIKNVTEDIFKSDNLNITIEKFLHDSSLGYGTDYGNVLKEFNKEPNLFNKKTILIIMGDGENTGKEIGDEYLKNISEQCKTTYWLHPKDVNEWYSAYCEMDSYEKYCKNVYQCSTLRMLEDFIKIIVKI